MWGRDRLLSTRLRPTPGMAVYYSTPEYSGPSVRQSGSSAQGGTKLLATSVLVGLYVVRDIITSSRYSLVVTLGRHSRPIIKTAKLGHRKTSNAIAKVDDKLSLPFLMGLQQEPIGSQIRRHLKVVGKYSLFTINFLLNSHSCAPARSCASA